jgi:hypothetical protein
MRNDQSSLGGRRKPIPHHSVEHGMAVSAQSQRFGCVKEMMEAIQCLPSRPKSHLYNQ